MNKNSILRLQELSTKCAEMQKGRYVLTDNELEEIEGFLAYLGFESTSEPDPDQSELEFVDGYIL